MDITKIMDWVIGSLIIGVLLIITNIISIIRAGKMMPREIKGADLSNKEIEADIVSKMDATLSTSLERVLDWQKRFDELDSKFRKQYEELKCLSEQLKLQEVTIIEQGNKIFELEKLSQSQKEEIDLLTGEVNNYYLWTNALVCQLQNVDLKPIKMEEVEGVDFSSKKKILKKNKNKEK